MHRRSIRTISVLSVVSAVAALGACSKGGNGSGTGDASKKPITFICSPQEDLCQAIAS